MWALALGEVAILAALAVLAMATVATHDDLASAACLGAMGAGLGYAFCYWPCPTKSVPDELVHATTPAALTGGIACGPETVRLAAGTRARVRFVPLLGVRPFRPRIYFYRPGAPGWVREFNTPKAVVLIRVRTSDLTAGTGARLYRRPIDGALAWPAADYTGPAAVTLEE